MNNNSSFKQLTSRACNLRNNEEAKNSLLAVLQALEYYEEFFNNKDKLVCKTKSNVEKFRKVAEGLVTSILGFCSYNSLEKMDLVGLSGYFFHGFYYLNNITEAQLNNVFGLPCKNGAEKHLQFEVIMKVTENKETAIKGWNKLKEIFATEIEICKKKYFKVIDSSLNIYFIGDDQ